jgi:hypothetical protein
MPAGAKPKETAGNRGKRRRAFPHFGAQKQGKAKQMSSLGRAPPPSLQGTAKAEESPAPSIRGNGFDCGLSGMAAV